MLGTMLSNAFVYVYAIWVLVLIAFCIANPPRVRRIFSWRPRRVYVGLGGPATALRFRRLR